jgi:hypothetical protein
VSLWLQFGLGWDSANPTEFAWTMLVTVGCSTAAWLTATLATAPETRDTLLTFYRRVRPPAALWGPIAREARDVEPVRDLRSNLFAWAAGCAMVYLTLFGTGWIIFGHVGVGLALLAGAAIAGWAIYVNLSRRGWQVLD